MNSEWNDCVGLDMILRNLAQLEIDGMTREWVDSHLKMCKQIFEVQKNTNVRNCVSKEDRKNTS